MMNIDKKKLLDYWRKDKVITNKSIMKAFSDVDRAKFIPEFQKKYAYDDIPLYIGEGQTISQPTTVAIMTQALGPKKGEKILEVGTGSGYQAALLSKIVGASGKVVSIEYLKPLYLFAKGNLKEFKNVLSLHGDGTKGAPSEAPFDKIIVTAAAKSIPRSLIQQLKEGGTLVIPVGDFIQTMLKIKKTKNGLEKKELGEFRFVPLVTDNF